MPVADQLDHLESGTDFESRFLQKAKKQSHPDNYSYQGIYLVAPNGVLMAGSHEALHDEKKVEKILQQGLEKWQKLSAKARLLPKEVFAIAVAERGQRVQGGGKSNIRKTGSFSVCSAATCPAVRRRPQSTKRCGIRTSRGFVRKRRLLSCPPS